MAIERGRLLAKLVELDDTYCGRYEIWKHTLKTGEVVREIPQVDFMTMGDPGYDQCVQMLSECLEVLPIYRGSMNYHSALDWFCDWLLWSFGHPSIKQAPAENGSYEKATKRLNKVFDLELLMRCPADYFSFILADKKYGQNNRGYRSVEFYPTWQPAARMIALGAAQATIHRTEKEPPFHVIDPCMGAGRLSLEASNYCRALTGWDISYLLIKCATVNFCLYAPDFAYPIPALGGDLVLGDWLTGEGTSFFKSTSVKRVMQLPPAVTAPEQKKRKPEKTVKIGDETYTETKSGDLQGAFF